MTRVRVLLVDDSPDFRAGAAAFLRGDPGISFLGSAASGSEALDWLQAASPDLVLLDLAMPGMSGFEFLRRCAGGPARIVVVSLNDDEERRALALSLGAAGFVAKSEFFGKLPSLVRQLFPGLPR